MEKKIIILLMLVLSLTIPLKAQKNKAEAAYIYNICRYMEWPEEYQKGNFIIAVLTKDGIIDELKELAKTKKYLNQTIEIKVFNSISAIEKCHVLYIPSEASSNTKIAFNTIKKYNTLLITNKKGQISQGAAINFILKSNKLKFELKKDYITNSGIKMSSSFEKLAEAVY